MRAILSILSFCLASGITIEVNPKTDSPCICTGEVRKPVRMELKEYRWKCSNGASYWLYIDSDYRDNSIRILEQGDMVYNRENHPNGMPYAETLYSISRQPFVVMAVGVAKFWWPSGVLASEFPFVGDQRHGTSKMWLSDGTLIKVEEYHYGKRNGVTKKWTMHGKLMWKKCYSHGLQFEDTDYERCAKWVSALYGSIRGL